MLCFLSKSAQIVTKKLEIRGTVELEAAWHHKSNWKYNLGVVARMKIWGGSTPKGQNVVSRKSSLGWVNVNSHNILFVDQSSLIFCPCGGGFVLCSWSCAILIFVCWSVLEICAIKVESCQELRQILDVFYTHTLWIEHHMLSAVSVIIAIHCTDWRPRKLHYCRINMRSSGHRTRARPVPHDPHTFLTQSTDRRLSDRW